MTAVFREVGTWPDFKEQFMSWVMRGLMAERLVFRSAVGKGSRAQVVGFILIMFSTSLCVTVVKSHRGWEWAWSGSSEGGAVRW